MKRTQQQRQSGMALVAALFLIVVLATLGVMALRINTAQQRAANLNLLGLRAQAAVLAGIEYGSNRALRAGVCAPGANLGLPALSGFTVRVRCAASHNHLVNGVPYTIYELDAFAWRGVYGSPDYVSRSASRTVSAIP